MEELILVILTILLVRKLRLKGVKSIAQEHLAYRWQSWDSPLKPMVGAIFIDRNRDRREVAPIRIPPNEIFRYKANKVCVRSIQRKLQDSDKRYQRRQTMMKDISIK